MKRFKRIIVGASSIGLGCLKASAENTLLIDSNSMIASDFAGAFYPGVFSEKFLNQQQEHKEIKEWQDRNIFCQGKVHLPGIHALFHQWFQPYLSQILLWTDIIDWKKVNNGFELTIYNRSGRQQLHCDELIDCSVEGQLKPSDQVITEKSIGVMLFQRDTNKTLPQNLTGKVFQTNFANECYWHIPLETEANWEDARLAIKTELLNQKDQLEGWILGAIGYQFFQKVKVASNLSYQRFVPHHYDNFLEAYLEGIKNFSKVEVYV